MKRVIFLLSIMTAIFASAIFSQNVQPQGQPAIEKANGPVITFEKTVHDYGTVPYKGDGKCTFKFTNTGNEPLILTNVRSSCGCTVPKWPREPILPGNSGVIHVEYSTDRVGMINKSITVQSNATNGDVTLRITGQVLPEGQSLMPEKPKSMGEK